MGGALEKIVDGGEEIGLAFLAMGSDRVGDGDGGADFGFRVARVHSPEECHIEAGVACHLGQVELLLLDQILGVGRRVFRGRAERGDLFGELHQVVDLGLPEDDDLFAVERREKGIEIAGIELFLGPAARLLRLIVPFLGVLVLFVEVELVLEGGQDGHHHQRVEAALDQGLGQADAEEGARTGTGRSDLREREGVFVLAPMVFQALRADAGAHCAAEGNLLGKARVVAVDERGGIAGERVDLDEHS